MRNYSCGNKASFALSLLVVLYTATLAQANDLIVNGNQTTLDGGTYNIVYLTNDGDLTVNGALTADTVKIEGSGLIKVGGVFSAREVNISDGTLTLSSNCVVSQDIVIAHGHFGVTGLTNSVRNISVNQGGIVSILGTWTATSLVVSEGGTLSPVIYDSNIPGSGKFWLNADTIDIQNGGVVNGDFAGNDPRGRAGSFADAGGGGYGGNGAHGWWDASGGGHAFGDYYTYVCDMGSAGGRMGGGGVAFVGNIVTIDGAIHCDGMKGKETGYQYAPGGGSGGCILIDANTLSLNGPLSARGGDGDSAAGPGSGGRIKIFYQTGGGTNMASYCDVSAGPNHTNKGLAGNGTVYFDAKPLPPTLVDPLSGETVFGNKVSFQFKVGDVSATSDDHSDALFSAIELSTDGFQSIAYRFDQSVSLAGWNAFSNHDGEIVTFTPPSTIANGTYRWRAKTSDRSLAGAYSLEQLLTVGSPGTMAGPVLQIAPAIRFTFQSGHLTYRLQVSTDLLTWTDTSTLITGDGSLMEYFLLVEPGARFYRLLGL